MMPRRPRLHQTRNVSKFTVFAVDKLDAGVYYDKYRTKVTATEEAMLLKKQHSFNIVVGAVYRTPMGKEKCSCTWMQSPKMNGAYLSSFISQKAFEESKKVNKDDLLTTFYFARATDEDIDERWVMDRLVELDVYEKFINRREKEINDAKTLHESGERVPSELIKKCDKHLAKMGKRTT